MFSAFLININSGCSDNNINTMKMHIEFDLIKMFRFFKGYCHEDKKYPHNYWTNLYFDNAEYV